MKKYQRETKEDLFRVTHNTDDHETLVTLTRDRNWNRIYTTAREEYSIKNIIEDQKYYDWYMSYKPIDPTDIMTPQQTKKYFNDWCAEQNIQPANLISDMHSILKMTEQKINTLYLQGASNAGKTFLLKGLVPIDSKVGYHTTSKDFPFGEAVNFPLIMINELTIESPAKAEVYKNIFGGEPTQINIKNKPSQLMGRKPVLVTNNHPLWREVANQKEPLLNRMKAYMNLRNSAVTRHYSRLGRPHPQFFQKAFEIFPSVNMPPISIIFHENVRQLVAKGGEMDGNRWKSVEN